VNENENAGRMIPKNFTGSANGKSYVSDTTVLSYVFTKLDRVCEIQGEHKVFP